MSHNTRMFDENGRIQLYHAQFPHAIIDCQYGKITCRLWLEQEFQRIEAKGVSCDLKTVHHGNYVQLELWVIPSAPIRIPTKKFEGPGRAFVHRVD